jgi:hypothetical protein
VVSQIAAGKPPDHDALSERGWWHHPDRISMPRGEEIAA